MDICSWKSTLAHCTSELRDGGSVTSLSTKAREDLEALLGLTDLARKRTAQYQIRRCLAFPDMHERFNVVDPAHFETFRWLLEEDTDDQSSCVPEARNKYLDWLSSGTGIFHIAGKLGSGKSTLMKFICGHPCTEAKLRTWAGECSWL